MISPAAWLLVLGWLPMLFGVRRGGFDPLVRSDGFDPGGRRGGFDPRGGSGGFDPPFRSGGLAPRVRARDTPPPELAPRRDARGRRLDDILLLLTWTAGAAVTALALRDQQRSPGGVRLAAGVALFLSGVAAWAAVRRVHGRDYSQLPRAPRGLVTRGPYRLVRHPLYLATGAAGLGQAIAGGAPSTVIAWVVLVLSLVIRARREERLLQAAFGAAWDAYAVAVPAWLPGWRAKPRSIG